MRDCRGARRQRENDTCSQVRTNGSAQSDVRVTQSMIMASLALTSCSVVWGAQAVPLEGWPRPATVAGEAVALGTALSGMFDSTPAALHSRTPADLATNCP